MLRKSPQPQHQQPPAMTGWGINSSAPSPWLRVLGCVYPTWIPGGPRGTKLHSPPAFTGCLSFPVLLPHPHWCFPESPPKYISGAAPREPLKDEDGQDVLPEACPTDSLPLPPSLPPTTPASPSLALEPSSSHSSSRGRLQAPRPVLGLSLLLWVFQRPNLVPEAVTDLSPLAARANLAWASWIPGRNAAHQKVRKFIQNQK